MKKVLFAILILFVLAGVAGMIANMVNEGQREDTLVAFTAQVPGYMAIWAGGVADQGATDARYLAGKAVIVEATRRVIDPLTFKLPERVQAQTPEEAEALVFITCRTPEVGSYTSGEIAREQECDIVAYDLGAGRVSATDRVVRLTSGSIAAGESGTAARPDNQILELINSLPGAE